MIDNKDNLNDTDFFCRRTRPSEEEIDREKANLASFSWVKRLRDEFAEMLPMFVDCYSEGEQLSIGDRCWQTDLGDGPIYVAVKSDAPEIGHAYCCAFKLIERIMGNIQQQNWTFVTRQAFMLGRLFERMYLQVQGAEEMVKLGQSFSRSQAARNKPRLSDDQFKKVVCVVESRDQRISIMDAFNDVAKQLAQGVFRELPRVKLEITGDALYRRWLRRKKSMGIPR